MSSKPSKNGDSSPQTAGNSGRRSASSKSTSLKDGPLDAFLSPKAKGSKDSRRASSKAGRGPHWANRGREHLPSKIDGDARARSRSRSREPSTSKAHRRSNMFQALSDEVSDEMAEDDDNDIVDDEDDADAEMKHLDHTLQQHFTESDEESLLAPSPFSKPSDAPSGSTTTPISTKVTPSTPNPSSMSGVPPKTPVNTGVPVTPGTAVTATTSTILSAARTKKSAATPTKKPAISAAKKGIKKKGKEKGGNPRPPILTTDPLTADATLPSSTAPLKPTEEEVPAVPLPDAHLKNPEKPPDRPAKKVKLPPGSSRDNPDTSMQDLPDSSDEEILALESGAIAGVEEQLQDTTLHDGSPLKPIQLLTDAPAPPLAGPVIDKAPQKGAADTSAAPSVDTPRPKLQYKEMHWYLMWNEMPQHLRDIPKGDTQEEEQIQQWFSAALDTLFDNGYPFSLLSTRDDNHRIKRKEDSFSHIFSRSICTHEEFLDFFDVQFYFTSTPHRVHIRTYIHQRKSDYTMKDYLNFVDNIRMSLGVSIGRDPGMESFPVPKFPLGYLPSALPADRNKYFLSCCGTNIKRSNLLRFTVRCKHTQLPSMLVAKPGDKPEKRLQKHVGTMFDRLQELTESNLAIIQYKATFKIPPITLKDGTFASQFEKMSIGTFRHYNNRGVIPRPKKHFWADVLLAFDGDSHHFTRDSYDDLDRELGAALYQKGIQTSEYMERPYWLLYSHPDIDYRFLEEELLLRTGAEIELRFQKVDDGTPKPKWVDDAPPAASKSDTSANALLLSCGADHSQHLSLALPSLFNRNRSGESFVTHLRLVSIHGSALTQREREYQISARARQSAYVRHAKTFVINSITDLDREILGYLGPITLRKFILSLTRPSDPLDKECLFVEVGPKVRNPGKVVLVVRPEAYAEAEPIVNGLLPIAVYTHGDEIKEAFHPTARIAMAEATWDPIRRIVISPTDAVYDTMHQDDDWMAFENLDDVDLPDDGASQQRIADATPPTLPPTAAESAAGRAMMGEDDAHTIGSLRDAQLNKAPPRNGKANGSKKPESSKQTIDQYKKALKILFAQNDMEFDSDEASISTSLSVKEQIKGIEQMFRDVSRVQATKEDMRKPPTPIISTQSVGEQSKSGSSGVSDGTAGASNQLFANRGSASQASK
jgi:hypothetical protein